MTTDDASAALSAIRYTLLIVGTNGPTGPHFMVANWGLQGSFDPWRYLLMLKKSSHTREYAERGKSFTINLLDGKERTLVAEIQKKKGNGFEAREGPAGAPRLARAFAGFDCKVLKVEDLGGDHVLVVADVVDGWKRGEGPALTLEDLKLSYAG